MDSSFVTVVSSTVVQRFQSKSFTEVCSAVILNALHLGCYFRLS